MKPPPLIFSREIYEIVKNTLNITTQKMKISIKDFFNKCEQIRSFLWIWSHLLKKYLMENFIFCAMYSYFFFLS